MLSSLGWIVFKDQTVFLVQTSLAMMTAELPNQVRKPCRLSLLVNMIEIHHKLWPSLHTSIKEHCV